MAKSFFFSIGCCTDETKIFAEEEIVVHSDGHIYGLKKETIKGQTIKTLCIDGEVPRQTDGFVDYDALSYVGPQKCPKCGMSFRENTQPSRMIVEYGYCGFGLCKGE